MMKFMFLLSGFLFGLVNSIRVAGAACVLLKTYSLLNENDGVFIQIALKFILMCPINNKPALKCLH